jgi:hypothetical protein
MSMRHFCQTVIGMVLAATPVALWVAWTPAMLAAVLAVAVLGAGLLVLITEEKAEGAAEDGARLPEAFLQEVQQLHPMIYHHSGRRSSRFQRTMRRLSAMMKETGRGQAPR